MSRLVDLLNWFTDMDWGWWPLLKYRPAKVEYLDSRVLVKITPFFGTLTGLVFCYIANAFASLTDVFVCLVSGWIVFFSFYRVTFSVAWNVRADRLNKKADSV